MNLVLTEHEAHIEQTTARRAELRAKLPAAERIAARIPLLEQEIKQATEAAEEDPSQRPKLRELQGEFSAILDAIRDGITVDSINAKLAQTAPAGLRIRHAALTGVRAELSSSIKARTKALPELRDMIAQAARYSSSTAAELPDRLVRAEAALALLTELANTLAADAAGVWKRMLED
jgi:chromosome segregation ATPase